MSSRPSRAGAAGRGAGRQAYRVVREARPAQAWARGVPWRTRRPIRAEEPSPGAPDRSKRTPSPCAVPASRAHVRQTSAKAWGATDASLPAGSAGFFTTGGAGRVRGSPRTFTCCVCLWTPVSPTPEPRAGAWRVDVAEAGTVRRFRRARDASGCGSGLRHAHPPPLPGLSRRRPSVHRRSPRRATDFPWPAAGFPRRQRGRGRRGRYGCGVRAARSSRPGRHPRPGCSRRSPGRRTGGRR